MLHTSPPQRVHLCSEYRGRAGRVRSPWTRGWFEFLLLEESLSDSSFWLLLTPPDCWALPVKESGIWTNAVFSEPGPSPPHQHNSGEDFCMSELMGHFLKKSDLRFTQGVWLKCRFLSLNFRFTDLGILAVSLENLNFLMHPHSFWEPQLENEATKSPEAHLYYTETPRAIFLWGEEGRILFLCASYRVLDIVSYACGLWAFSFKWRSCIRSSHSPTLKNKSPQEEHHILQS